MTVDLVRFLIRPIEEITYATSIVFASSATGEVTCCRIPNGTGVASATRYSTMDPRKPMVPMPIIIFSLSLYVSQAHVSYVW